MDKKEWSTSWEKHLENYLKAPARTGIFAKAYLKGVASSLELGCGSGRDSIYLARYGIEAIATDYEPTVIGKLQEQFKDSNLPVKFREADAFNLPFQDHKFDLVFHNGLFIYFNNNQDIINMLYEQKRISQKYILILAHNKTNSRLVTQFEALSQSDSIYDIRFFTKEELYQIVKSSQINAKSIQFLKFGGRFDKFYEIFKKFKISFFERWIPYLYQWQRWKKTERIACLIELE